MNRLLAFLALLLLAACDGLAPPPEAPAAGPVTVTAPAGAPAPAPDLRVITVLYTNDEHGWMEGVSAGRGAANLLGVWRADEGYTPGGPFLLLSGGDMWTGPAISTWFDGESMAEVMNAMAYDGAAVGNHEFDFGLDTLRRRAAQSDFPFLSANIREKANGAVPADAGFVSSVVLERNGITVGLIGLTTLSTPRTTNPVNVAAFDFVAYESALREVVPAVQAAGAELILVPAHVCESELVALAERIGDLGVHMLGGGHCNELFAREVNGIVLIGGGYHLTSYARATFTVDVGQGAVVDRGFGVGFNRDGAAEPGVAAIVDRWRDEADAELEQPIGYSQLGIERRSAAMETLITGAWLWGYPGADVAFTNRGGIRASLPRGELSLSDVVGVMPFDNVIIALQLPGDALIDLTRRDSLTFGGLRRAGGQWVLARTGEPVDPGTTYTVLTNDFLYAGGDGLDQLARLDPAGYNTGIDWRQPVIDWILAQESTADRPLEPALDALGE